MPSKRDVLEQLKNATSSKPLSNDSAWRCEIAESGVEAMRERREGSLTLRTHEIAPISLPPMDLPI